MKRLFCYAVIGLIAAGCGKKEEAVEAKTEAKSETPWKVGLSTNGEPVVTLDAETQKRIGLAVAPITTSEQREETKAYGRVLDPSALADGVNQLEAARAAAKVSAQELERLKNLSAQNNASARALQSAEAAATRDQLAMEAAQTKLALTWGNALAKRSDLTEFVKPLIAGEAALVQVDLPAGENLQPLPERAHMAVLGAEEHPIDAELLGAAPSVDPQTQGRAILFLAKSAKLSPNAAVTTHLELPGKSSTAAVIPRDAILRHDGATWVFVQTSETEFVRRHITLSSATDSGWRIREKFLPDEKIVSAGAQTLLSTELSAKGFQSGDRD